MMMTLVISTKINLKVGDDPVVKEVQEWCNRLWIAVCWCGYTITGRGKNNKKGE
jgi:hypothetical protein